MSKKIIFLIPYPVGEAPSQRFRFEQYFQILRQNGFQLSVQSFLDKPYWRLFFASGNLQLKSIAVISGIFKRLMLILTVPKYDFVFIHREVIPFGPPIFEWVLAKIFRKKIIFDFDDAIWLTDRNRESFFIRIVKYRSKVQSICRWSSKVSCGNEYLCSFAHLHNNQVVLNPTTVDTQNHHSPDLFPLPAKRSDKITIGWTGSHSTLKYLKEVEPILQKIESKFQNVQFLVIADQNPKLNLHSFKYIPWNEKTEVQDLLCFDIGIMPLPDDEWSKGKCGFKLLQYMSLRIPAVASPVGVNKIIIDEGTNGFLCNSLEHWEQALSALIHNETLRKQMGNNGRRKIIDHYSVESNASNFLSLFE